MQYRQQWKTVFFTFSPFTLSSCNVGHHFHFSLAHSLTALDSRAQRRGDVLVQDQNNVSARVMLTTASQQLQRLTLRRTPPHDVSKRRRKEVDPGEDQSAGIAARGYLADTKRKAATYDNPATLVCEVVATMLGRRVRREGNQAPWKRKMPPTASGSERLDAAKLLTRNYCIAAKRRYVRLVVLKS